MSTLVEIEEAAEQLDHTEKLHLMETLWDGLSRKGAGLESPAWHKEILEERRARVAAGKEGYSEWEEAKRDIRSRVE